MKLLSVNCPPMPEVVAQVSRERWEAPGVVRSSRRRFYALVLVSLLTWILPAMPVPLPDALTCFLPLFTSTSEFSRAFPSSRLPHSQASG